MNLSAALLSLLAVAASGTTATTISGAVRNGTTGGPAAGIGVALFGLADGSVKAQGRTDAQGRFALAVPDATTALVLRATRDGVDYDRRCAPGDTLDLAVFDARTDVAPISGVVGIYRLATRGPRLHVSELYDVRNDSNPPRTLVGPRTFEVYLPPGARVTSLVAASAASAAGPVVATPIAGEPGHRAVAAPLRPGETRFSVTYDVAYDGRFAFQPRLAYDVRQLAIMLPASMRFASGSQRFHPLLDQTGSRVYAANDVAAGDVPAFEVSGNGGLPMLAVAAPVAPKARRGRSPEALALEAVALAAVIALAFGWRLSGRRRAARSALSS